MAKPGQDRDTKASKASAQQPPSPAKTLLSVLGKNWVRGIALASLCGAIALCLLAIFAPQSVQTPTAHVWLCVLAAFLFFLFVFTLFPANYVLKDSSRIALPLILVGPAALWIGLAAIFLGLVPKPEPILHHFRQISAPTILTHDTMWIVQWDKTPKAAYVLLQPQTLGVRPQTRVEGFSIEFAEGAEVHHATIGRGPDATHLAERYDLVFARGSNSYTVRAAQGVQK